uniref:Uncharacterized protein n=1 Tax=Rhizophora mucronata TaxID=61149 RepID=A0A2P2J339_RHIMU
MLWFYFKLGFVDVDYWIGGENR